MMNTFNYLFFILSLIVYLLFNHYSKSCFELCETDKCPYCYGEDMCDSFKNNQIHLQSDTLIKFFYNYISVKNVYFGKFGNDAVILKKLAHSSVLDRFDDQVKNKKHINKFELLNTLHLQAGEEYKHFKTCNIKTSERFLSYFENKNAHNLQTLLKINAEPLLFEIFPEHESWNVPTLYGYCGRIVIVKNCGVPLINIQHNDWYDRAYVAYQLLKEARKFTEGHQDFRLYLTDISPDNIVVDSNLKVSFVDLGNAILLEKTEKVINVHHTTHSNDEDFTFSEYEICEADISDHNIYSICWLLLSKDAPWPMMNNGLLHSYPDEILHNYSDLIRNIDLCVHSVDKKSRFNISDQIVNTLEKVLGKYFRNK